MNTPETINIEKYAEALNNLIGVDSAYMVGDKDVDAIVELIVTAKKLENRVKELTEENKRLEGMNRLENEDEHCVGFHCDVSEGCDPEGCLKCQWNSDCNVCENRYYCEEEEE